jgi:hypothetical protein
MASPAYSVLIIPGGTSTYVLQSVNFDDVFQFLQATGTLTWPRALTWEELINLLKANPLTAVLALSLVQTGGSGPGMFPRQNCPKGPGFSDPTKSPGKDWEWRGKGAVGSSPGELV